MVGFSNFQAWGADTDTLLRRAQIGDLDAYKELIRRGEEVPPPGDPVGRFGRHGRPGGPPVPVLGLERPAYLDRGISRNMARPAADAPDQAPTLPMMSAIKPQQQEAPSYLGMGLGQTAPDDDPIQRIADGNDAAAPIQQGAAAADTDTGATPQDPASVVPGPLGALATALESEDPNGYSGYIGDIIKSLQQGSDPDANRRSALATAGFAMAASGSPFFFQAVGQGGMAGMKRYQELQNQDVENQVRAATLAGKELERAEDVRKHKADEAHDQAVLTETQRSNIADEKERARSNRAQEALQQGQLAISSQNAQTALGTLHQRQREFEEQKRQYEEGQTTERELKRAEIEYRKALTKAQQALEVDRNTDVIYTDDGGAAIVNKTDGTSVPIVDKDGNPIKAMPKNQSLTALQKNTKYYVDIGLFPDERSAAAAQMRGKSMSPDRRLIEAYQMADSQMSAHPELMGDAADAKREEWAQQYYDLLGGDAMPQSQAPGAGNTPSSAAPGTSPYKTPDDVKRDYQAGNISKDQARQFIEQMQRGQ